jgi:aspartate racemase
MKSSRDTSAGPLPVAVVPGAPDLLGVLGGMGPAATVDFMAKVIALTPAARDQDHIPMVVHHLPQTPDRTAFLLHGGESPQPALLAGARFLKASGARWLAIPCNTAHAWFDEIVAASELPGIHIADAVIGQLRNAGVAGCAVGLLGTSGTARSGLYQGRLRDAGFEAITPDSADQADLVDRGIYLVKAGKAAAAGKLLKQAEARLVSRGAIATVLACTEIPLVLKAIPLGPIRIDATEALARACVETCTRRAAKDRAP